MVESYVQPRFLFFTSTGVSFYNLTCAFLDLYKHYGFRDTLKLHLKTKIPVRFYVSSTLSDQVLIEVLVLS
jgi:hypothetical protein